MRILNLAQCYLPFLELGGPPVKVRSLSRQLAKLGHHVTVLTADWGLQSRAWAAAGSSAERSAWGWRLEESGIEGIYLPNQLHFRALSWNPGIPAQPPEVQLVRQGNRSERHTSELQSHLDLLFR